MKLEEKLGRKLESIKSRWKAIGGSKKCSVENCTKLIQVRSHNGTGYCKAHAQELDEEAYNNLRDKTSCGVEGCLKQAKGGTGYCIAHAQELDEKAYDNLRDKASCGVEDCLKQAKGGTGYCGAHARELVPELHREMRARLNAWFKERYHTDKLFRTAIIVRTRLRHELKRIGKSYTGKVGTLGCSVKRFCAYTESQFEPWMNWNNQGGREEDVDTWESDHIRSVKQHFDDSANGDITFDELIERVNHWSNFQPIHWKKNQAKGGDKVEGFAWDEEKKRYIWDETSGRTNYELPEDDEDEDEDFEQLVDEDEG